MALEVLRLSPKSPAGGALVDDLTRRMTAAMRQARRGHHRPSEVRHTCPCGWVADGFGYFVSPGVMTTDLAVHLLAYHRAEIPDAELKKAEDLASFFKPVDPCELSEMRPPPSGWLNPASLAAGPVTLVDAPSPPTPTTGLAAAPPLRSLFPDGLPLGVRGRGHAAEAVALDGLALVARFLESWERWKDKSLPHLQDRVDWRRALVDEVERQLGLK
jgi:hypothetical protein